MEERELRMEAVRRRLSGESPTEIAEGLGRSTRWVRKWVIRARDGDSDWALDRSRAPYTSPRRTPDHVRRAVVEVRGRLASNPRSQFGAVAIAWELRRLGMRPVPELWTINRILASEGLSKPRRRQARYQAKGVPYPWTLPAAAGVGHQGDLLGPRHLEGGVQFSVLNTIDLGSHRVATEIIERLWPPGLASALVASWHRLGLPRTVQFDNHSNFRGGIPPRSSQFGPVVAACLDLGVTPRFIPLREPWRNGVVEHFNDTWERLFFRTTRFKTLDQLRTEARDFEAFHNHHHRYSAHAGATPEQAARGINLNRPPKRYQLPTSLPAKGRIEAVRFIRSNGVLDLWGHKVLFEPEHSYRYVLATIRVRAQEVIVVTDDGEIIHSGGFPISRTLR